MYIHAYVHLYTHTYVHIPYTCTHIYIYIHIPTNIHETVTGWPWTHNFSILAYLVLGLHKCTQHVGKYCQYMNNQTVHGLDFQGFFSMIVLFTWINLKKREPLSWKFLKQLGNADGSHQEQVEDNLPSSLSRTLGNFLIYALCLHVWGFHLLLLA